MDPPIVFLDTYIILDYIEIRNREVHELLSTLFLLHQKNKIRLATSIFNIAEVIDKEFQIHFIGEFLKEKLSYDEIAKKRGDRKEFRRISKKFQEDIEKKVRKFIFEKGILIFSLPLETEEDYQELYNLIYEYQFSSQDALIILTALKNNVTYFISNDHEIVQKINDNGWMYVYNLRDEDQRKEFKNSFVEALI